MTNIRMDKLCYKLYKNTGQNMKKNRYILFIYTVIGFSLIMLGYGCKNSQKETGFSPIFKTAPKDINTTTETNVTSFLHVLRAVVPGMVERKRGHIINLGSIAGLYPMASSVYGGSKGAVHLINQNLRLELSGTGVRATEICPGRVETEFFDVAFSDNPEKKKEMTSGLTLLTKEDIADAIMFAINAPWRMNVSLIEITPTEQTPGGSKIERAK